MEFMLRPAHHGNPPIPVPRTPYICDERYDGGPWMTYPTRKNIPITAWNGTSFDLLEYHRSSRTHPLTRQKQESFLQTWLFFGLIAEFIGINDSAAEKGTGSKEQLDKLYDSILVKENGTTYVALESANFDSFLEIFRSRISPGLEIRKNRYQHLILCLTYAHPILMAVPREFNYAVRTSIAALGDLLIHSLDFGLERLGLPRYFGRKWSNKFFTDEVKNSMMGQGWCPSDIARAEAKYVSMQTLFIVRMLDKSLPPRDHSGCTDIACNMYQINLGEYQVSHGHDQCRCERVEISSDDLTSILEKKDIFPLLRITGDADNLNVELVESGPDIPYIAISHVWADGLGNPNANSLHRCRLHRLHQYVKTMPQPDQEADHPAPIPLIWLDTLCCPAKEDDRNGKQMAIEKIRLVYRQAKHVLVLDASLMAYNSQPQDVSEQVVRIFTSSWMRRLWTLQEGALAQSLYFQFADTSVSFANLGKSLLGMRHSMRHRSVLVDMIKEFIALGSFLTPDNPPTLTRLDEALKYRSVSVATDEPLCIGTLMSLELPDILGVERKEDRMQKVWELLTAKNHGMPAQIIFFQEPRINHAGWRWAPQSLLTITKSIFDMNSRMVRWGEPQLGTVSSDGLRVQYPGWRVSAIKTYNDNKPLNPFPGFEPVSESYVSFRCSSTGHWFRIVSKDHAYQSQLWKTDEERIAYNKLNSSPFQKLADAQDSILVAKEATADVVEALFAEVIRKREDGICVRTLKHVMIHHLHIDHGYIYDTSRRLAIESRSHKLTEQHLAIYKRLIEEFKIAQNESPMIMEETSLEALQEFIGESEELKASIKALRAEMKERMRSVIAGDERLAKAITRFFGESFLEDLWVLIYDFFYHDHYEGERIGEEQVWYID